MPFQSITGALAQIGNHHCQDALRKLIELKGHRVSTQAALISLLSRVRLPEAASVALFNKLVEDSKDAHVREASLFGLGAMALMLRRSHPRRASLITKRLVAQLKNAKEPEALISILGAIGNSGEQNALPGIRPHLNHTIEAVRSAAIRSVRWMPSADADKILADGMKHDSSAPIRLSIVEVYGYRPISDIAYEGLRYSATRDINPLIRRRAIAILFRERFQRPALIDVVRKLARTDTNEDVRKEAERLIELVEE